MCSWLFALAQRIIIAHRFLSSNMRCSPPQLPRTSRAAQGAALAASRRCPCAARAPACCVCAALAQQRHTSQYPTKIKKYSILFTPYPSGGEVPAACGLRGQRAGGDRRVKSGRVSVRVRGVGVGGGRFTSLNPHLIPNTGFRHI